MEPLGQEGTRASVSEVTDAVNAAYGLSIRGPLFRHLSVARCPLPVPFPFPSIFGNFVGKRGELQSSPIPGSLAKGLLDVHSILMAARLRSISAALPILRNRLCNLHRFGIQRGVPGAEIVRNLGFGKDKLQYIKETLAKMVMTLDPSSQAYSDSDQVLWSWASETLKMASARRKGPTRKGIKRIKNFNSTCHQIDFVIRFLEATAVIADVVVPLHAVVGEEKAVPEVGGAALPVFEHGKCSHHQRCPKPKKVMFRQCQYVGTQ